MYATIRRYENNPDLADRLAARSDEIQSLMSAVDGFRAYHLLRSNDGTASITVCDDQAGTEETIGSQPAGCRRTCPMPCRPPLR